MNLSQQFRKGFTAIIQKTRLFNKQQQLIPLIKTIADDKPKQQISAYQQHLDKIASQPTTIFDKKCALALTDVRISSNVFVDFS